MTLQAQDLTLALGGTRVLDGLSAGFLAGQVTAVLGPNGAGKSSLLACLAGLRAPDSGMVLLGGVPRTDIPRRDLARRIGFLPQTADVNWDVDVGTLVALGRFPHRGRWGETEADRAAIAAAMAATDVAALSGRVVNSLSGGERGRVLLARVLAGSPEWLLADEPLASLDPAHQLDVLDCLRGIAARGAGVIVVLHDLNQAARVADAVVLMRCGRIIAHGPPEAVLTPALIAETYGVSAHVGHTPDGQRFIIATGRC
ncbi:ABC transporter ATP-binding protein [Polymorphobacter multimanifer]|uniref:Iron complex transport system ATP-binding protein n=1 Tax=Polymorphobacter multimanifer TaxID=1070431 RepID=A0A841L0B8_9SPHN|nr:ABC transporter ATP-binding protein [Polymorphobacter multimanifer]MBB6226269.1 iron complex transport system ATP-binding protein [Polymorphobacter multimanifer]GGI81818.1 ABC transporter ATP-binding protein [Polymorphobacter multimanifer]